MGVKQFRTGRDRKNCDILLKMSLCYLSVATLVVFR